MNAPIKPLSGETPVTIEGHDTVPRLFRHRTLSSRDRVALREKNLGIWQSVTWGEYGDHARWIGLGLISLGLERGDAVAVLSENNKEWLFVDYGVICVGGVTNGVYTTDSAKQLAYLVNDSESTFLFVEDEEQLDKFLEVRDQMPTVKKVFVFDMKGLRDFRDDMVAPIGDLYEAGRAFGDAHPGRWDEEVEKAAADDTAVLIYTSGTTGPPKGAMITHRNILFQISNASDINAITPEDEQLSFLPLCHIAERSFTTFWPLKSQARVNLAESAETVLEDIQEVAPTVFFAVPRIWEKFYSGVLIRLQSATFLGQLAYKWAIGVGEKRARYLMEGAQPPLGNKITWWFANRLVLHNLKTIIGLYKLRWGLTGAAPISPDLIKWYWAIGVRLYEVYGQTENTGVASSNNDEHLKVGTIGVCAPNTEMRISEEGEILIKGPHVFKGYLNQPEKTAQTITDGWLHTGDVGRVDNQGFYVITDRIKDIIITAGGKNVTPSEIENQLKFSPYISDAVIIGDKRKFLSCLVMIDEDNVMQYAQRNSIPFSNYASLCRQPQIQELIGAEVTKVNKQFARVEQIKKFRLIDQLLNPEDDELTPTMKLKRSFVGEKYKPLIEDMYNDSSPVAGP